ncbi:MAG: CoA-binding protein [Bacteroidia bacterium]|nr:CoA-binding protein [Bacteroidia bacterium]
MASLKQIEGFLSSTPIAMAGVSRNPKKFGHAAFKELRQKGLDLIPINPVADEILGVKAYRDIASVPVSVNGVLIMTKKDQTAGIVRDAKIRGIKNIWIQQMADSREAMKELEGSDINYVTGECILMHYKPHSVHKFHKAIRKFFGVFPK